MHDRKALVLGNPAIARLIADQMENFDTLIAEEDSPLRDVSELKAALAAFFAANSSGSSAARLWVHPGVSPWASRPELPILAQEIGLHVVAPPVRALHFFWNKAALFLEAESLGIPNLALDFDPLHTIREIEHAISGYRHPFPFVLKTLKASGHMGIIVIHAEEELKTRLPLWLEQLRKNQGEVLLFAERYLEGARHLVLPFARFENGDFEAFPVSDASLQCRFRKIAEFCPASGIDDVMETRLRGWTRELADRCGYVGVGVLEFLIDGSRAFLVEGSPRLNANFPLWEKIAGTRAVSWQLATILGEKRPALQPKWRSGVALRLYAEDPILQLPQPGVVKEISEKKEWDFPSARAELSLGIKLGQDLESQGVDGWLGQLFVCAQNMRQALDIARGALGEIWIAGSLETNERFLSELLSHPWVKESVFHAGFVDEEFLSETRPPAELSKIAARAAREGISGTATLEDGRKMRIHVFPIAPKKWRVRVGNWFFKIREQNLSLAQPKVLSLLPGRVYALYFREGSTVPAHEPLVILESLGILVPHSLPVDAKIVRWKIKPEDRVQAGQELVEVEIAAKN